VNFELAEEHRMLKDLVRRFVADELMPLEAEVLAREAAGGSPALSEDERKRIDQVSRELGLWGLDAPEDIGGSDLPAVAMVGVNEELAMTVTPYTLPPDSPNLRMMMATVNERQREAYLAPYVRGETISAIGISEPGAGADPSGMITRARRGRLHHPDGGDRPGKGLSRRHFRLPGRPRHPRLQRPAPHSHGRWGLDL
jgi:acyl-CoA dehydrogenase